LEQAPTKTIQVYTATQTSDTHRQLCEAGVVKLVLGIIDLISLNGETVLHTTSPTEFFQNPAEEQKHLFEDYAIGVSMTHTPQLVFF